MVSASACRFYRAKTFSASAATQPLSASNCLMASFTLVPADLAIACSKKPPVCLLAASPRRADAVYKVRDWTTALVEWREFVTRQATEVLIRLHFLLMTPTRRDERALRCILARRALLSVLRVVLGATSAATQPPTRPRRGFRLSPQASPPTSRPSHAALQRAETVSGCCRRHALSDDAPSRLSYSSSCHLPLRRLHTLSLSPRSEWVVAVVLLVWLARKRHVNACSEAGGGAHKRSESNQRQRRKNKHRRSAKQR